MSPPLPRSPPRDPDPPQTPSLTWAEGMFWGRYPALVQWKRPLGHAAVPGGGSGGSGQDTWVPRGVSLVFRGAGRGLTGLVGAITTVAIVIVDPGEGDGGGTVQTGEGLRGLVEVMVWGGRGGGTRTYIGRGLGGVRCRGHPPQTRHSLERETPRGRVTSTVPGSTGTSTGTSSSSGGSMAGRRGEGGWGLRSGLLPPTPGPIEPPYRGLPRPLQSSSHPRASYVPVDPPITPPGSPTAPPGPLQTP